MESESGHFHRHSIRLQGYDYRQAGAYFVTLATAGREAIFGEIVDSDMTLNNSGRLVAALWQALPLHFPVASDDWVVMPNHLHGIIILRPEDMGIQGDGSYDGFNRVSKEDRASGCRGEASGDNFLDSRTAKFPDASPLRGPAPQSIPRTNAPDSRPTGTDLGSLGAIIQNFKSVSTRRVNALCNTPSARLWQRNYYEHIIRDEQDWASIARYIQANPQQWKEDTDFSPG